jgi:hypothetical protein
MKIEKSNHFFQAVLSLYQSTLIGDVERSTVKIKSHLSTVDPVLAAVHPVVDQYQVDLVFGLKVHLPPIVPVRPAVS